MWALRSGHERAHHPGRQRRARHPTLPPTPAAGLLRLFVGVALVGIGGGLPPTPAAP
ncbi:hypothetical protein DEGR_19010 [Deinococcus grandis]|nr:hypothetical protein DEGR_19010 [Deinococcus grandis]